MPRTYTTWQVMRHLERQPELVFEATTVDETGWSYRRIYSSANHILCSSYSGEVCPIPKRSDWRLVSGTIRKSPRRRVKLGTIDLANTTRGTPDLTKPRSVALSDDVAEALRRTGKRWRLVAVEVEEQ